MSLNFCFCSSRGEELPFYKPWLPHLRDDFFQHHSQVGGVIQSLFLLPKLCFSPHISPTLYRLSPAVSHSRGGKPSGLPSDSLVLPEMHLCLGSAGEWQNWRDVFFLSVLVEEVVLFGRCLVMVFLLKDIEMTKVWSNSECYIEWWTVRWLWDSCKQRTKPKSLPPKNWYSKVYCFWHGGSSSYPG